MRVIAGSARSLRLKTLDGMETRPTTDRIKETLFNIIGPSVYDSVFLDLFSGSGGIGIEALSRGAKEAFFVEKKSQSYVLHQRKPEIHTPGNQGCYDYQRCDGCTVQTGRRKSI